MLALREAGLTLAEIGRRYGVSRQRVDQIITRTGRASGEEVKLTRREIARRVDARRLSGRTDEVIERFRQGSHPLQIARDTGLAVRLVREVIAERASDRDREARKQAWMARRRDPAARFSDQALLEALRRAAGELGHTPSYQEYVAFARSTGLPSGGTVHMRFGGWNRALREAGLDALEAGRLYSPRWHVAACWHAVLSVADQLGDPPRCARYREIADGRDDLPSAATLRVRLGMWSGIAAALTEYRDRSNGSLSSQTGKPKEVARVVSSNGSDRTGEPPVLPSLLAKRVLRYLAEHGDARARAVKDAVGIRHYSQLSQLLTRLEREGLLRRQRDGVADRWALTRQGRDLLEGLPEVAYA